VEKNWEKAWDHCYVTDRKWWTRLVQTESTLCTNRVHHFRSGIIGMSQTGNGGPG